MMNGKMTISIMNTLLTQAPHTYKHKQDKK